MHIYIYMCISYAVMCTNTCIYIYKLFTYTYMWRGPRAESKAGTPGLKIIIISTIIINSIIMNIVIIMSLLLSLLYLLLVVVVIVVAALVLAKLLICQ